MCTEINVNAVTKRRVPGKIKKTMILNINGVPAENCQGKI